MNLNSNSSPKFETNIAGTSHTRAKLCMTLWAPGMTEEDFETLSNRMQYIEDITRRREDMNFIFEW